MKNKPELKHLIEDIAIMPTIAHIAVDLLRAEIPFLRVIKSWDEKIAKPNKEIIEGKQSYDGVELTLWGFFDRHWNANWKRVKAIKKNKIPMYTFHGCFETCPRSLKGYYLNLSLDNRYTTKALKSHIDIAAGLACGDNPIVVFHPGTANRHISKERALDNIMYNLSSALSYAERRGVILTLENMPYALRAKRQCTMLDHYDFQYVFRRLQHNNLKITFDWGHLNTQIRNRQFMKKHGFTADDALRFEHINEFIDKMKDNIVHCHTHYNRSHFLKIPADSSEHKRDYKKILLYLFYWTDLVKFFREGYKNTPDEHLPYTRITSDHLLFYKKTIENLINNTAIRQYGYITHELPPKKILKYFTFHRQGVMDNDEFIESLRIFKSLYQNNLD
ncbi:sugar phosphate isomerase/epimerase [Patescibacteria group bacterium]|nr:sugar phosphate isomerase/epimerase [Patescibacteria group bacterium]